MANDFSADANCKALWRLESGALTVDSKGGNTLTNQGVDEDLVNFKEGACSGFFVRASIDRMTIADADLDAGFPLKSDAAHTSFSFVGWIKLTATGLYQYILNKYNSSLILQVDNANKVTLSLYDGAWRAYVHGSALAADTWYHFAVTHNDADNAYRIRIWDDTAGAILGVDKTGIAVTPNLGNANFTLGTSATSAFGGNEDEVVAFNDVLSVDEIDAIRAGTYGGGAPPVVVKKLVRDRTRGSYVNRKCVSKSIIIN